MKKKIWIHIVLACAVLAGVLVWFLWSAGEPAKETSNVQVSVGETTESQAAEQEPATEESSATEEEEPIPESHAGEYDVTLMALGDNLMHMGIVYTGRQQDGTFDYTVLFEGIKDFLRQADIKVINQETILAGNELGFSGFPYFNSPTEVGDAIAAAGFNVVLQASNHSADQGLSGLQNCARFWAKYPEILMVGIYEEKNTEPEIPLMTIDGVTFAVLNYTYGPNMEVLSDSLYGHLELLCNRDDRTGRLDFTTIHPKVLSDIAKAEELADIVIVCPHWGAEYMTKPTKYQKEFAVQMAEAGADVIIGTHPHVVQPVEWVEADNGNRALCYYSLGNYVSTQKDGISMLEAMAWVTFHVSDEGVSVQEHTSGVIPLVCHYKSGPVRLQQVYPLDQYTEELAAAHGIHNYGGVDLKLSDLQTWSKEILGDWVLPSQAITDDTMDVVRGGKE